MDEQRDVAVVGLGYVGLTLAVAFAEAGLRVLGADSSERVVTELGRGRAPFHERGIDEALPGLVPELLVVTARLPDELPRAVVICVGTPIDEDAKRPRLDQLEGALKAVAERIGP